MEGEKGSRLMSRLKKMIDNQVNEEKGDDVKARFYYKSIVKDLNELLKVSMRVLGENHKTSKDLENALRLIMKGVNDIMSVAVKEK